MYMWYMHGICGFACMWSYMFVQAHMCVQLCEGSTLIPGIFLDHSSFGLLRHGLTEPIT